MSDKNKPENNPEIISHEIFADLGLTQEIVIGYSARLDKENKHRVSLVVARLQPDSRAGFMSETRNLPVEHSDEFLKSWRGIGIYGIRTETREWLAGGNRQTAIMVSAAPKFIRKVPLNFFLYHDSLAFPNDQI